MRIDSIMNACEKGHKEIVKLLKTRFARNFESVKFILEKFENYVEHYLCKDRPWLPPRLPNAGLERPQRPLGQWAVVLQRVVESREAENPILVFEVLPEIRNWCDPLGPVKH